MRQNITDGWEGGGTDRMRGMGYIVIVWSAGSGREEFGCVEVSDPGRGGWIVYCGLLRLSWRRLC